MRKILLLAQLFLICNTTKTEEGSLTAYFSENLTIPGFKCLIKE